MLAPPGSPKVRPRSVARTSARTTRSDAATSSVSDENRGASDATSIGAGPLVAAGSSAAGPGARVRATAATVAIATAPSGPASRASLTSRRPRR